MKPTLTSTPSREASKATGEKAARPYRERGETSVGDLSGEGPGSQVHCRTFQLGRAGLDWAEKLGEPAVTSR